MLFHEAFQSVVNLFFPRVCGGCGNDLYGSEEVICIRCADMLPTTNFHVHGNNPVEKIFWGRLPLVAACSYLYFTKDSLLQRLMHSFKYNGNREIGLFFGRQMGKSFLQSNRFDRFDALIPLPLHPRKEKQRGYNQATVLCDGIAETMRIPVLKDAIVRSMITETQTRKNRISRWQNMEGKFVVKPEHLLRQKHVLLIDDVVTTGATLESCGLELLKVEGLRLSIATLAYTCK
jgi:ComF family protein